MQQSELSDEQLGLRSLKTQEDGEHLPSLPGALLLCWLCSPTSRAVWIVRDESLGSAGQGFLSLTDFAAKEKLNDCLDTIFVQPPKHPLKALWMVSL